MLRILLAEDEEDLREVVCEWLRADGFEVVPVADGQEALARLSRDPAYDVVLLDHEMPGPRGLEVLETLRTRGDRIAVLLMSGSLVLEAAELARLGLGPVLHKPIALTALSAAVRRAAATR